MIGILIVAHGTLGDSLDRRGHARARQPPARSSRACASPRADDPLRSAAERARASVKALDSGDGVLDLLRYLRRDAVQPRRQAAASRGASRPSPASTCRCWCARSPTAAKGMDTMIKKAHQRRLRRRAARRGRPDLCSNAKLRSSTSWGCTRALGEADAACGASINARSRSRATDARSTPRASWA